MLSGAVLSAPAVLHHENSLAFPFNVGLGLGCWSHRFRRQGRNTIITPFIDLSLYRWIRRNLKKPRVDRQILLLVLIAAMEMIPRLDRSSSTPLVRAGF